MTSLKVLCHLFTSLRESSKYFTSFKVLCHPLMPLLSVFCIFLTLLKVLHHFLKSLRAFFQYFTSFKVFCHPFIWLHFIPFLSLRFKFFVIFLPTHSTFRVIPIFSNILSSHPPVICSPHSKFSFHPLTCH